MNYYESQRKQLIFFGQSIMLQINRLKQKELRKIKILNKNN